MRCQPQYPPPILKRAERSDIKEIVRLTFDAESNSVVSFIMYRTPEEKLAAQNHLITELQRSWDDPRLIAIKALDPITKQMTAIALWTLRGYKKDELEVEALQEGESTSYGEGELQKVLLALYSGSRVGESGERLGSYIEKGIQKFIDTWARQSKHIYLALLMTDPNFQRRGIGTAMLEWGHKLADRHGVPAFLVATPVGYPLYKSMGWKELDDGLRIDLRNWVASAQTGNKGLGEYKYYFMLRLPNTASTDSFGNIGSGLK
jgi:GNAT superfamily N-acetyltransferase